MPDDISGKRSRKATANRILTVLKAILNKAFYDELIDDNIIWRRVKPFENVEQAKIRFLTEMECKRLINAARPDFRDLIKAALFTGARCSELTQLEVSNINIDTASIYISPSKNNKGRYIPLSPEGLDFFKIAILSKHTNNRVFSKQDGNLWGENHHTRLMKEACCHANITPAIGFHELRHTYASLLAQAGADLLTISKLLGHADTRITSRHYAHLCDKTLANAVTKLLPSFGHEKEGKIRNIA
jgi:integrase